MTKPTKKLTTYQRGVIALRQEREWKARETVRAEALRRERYRDAANDAVVREARHSAAMDHRRRASSARTSVTGLQPGRAALTTACQTAKPALYCAGTASAHAGLRWRPARGAALPL